eukprot:5562638-Pleurochrysis_carterae.AAC.2
MRDRRVAQRDAHTDDDLPALLARGVGGYLASRPSGNFGGYSIDQDCGDGIVESLGVFLLRGGAGGSDE